MSEKALNYARYLRLDGLLAQQQPRSSGAEGAEHDELLFIIVHQVYELWFKQILHELDHLQVLLRANEPARSAHIMRRILKILKTIVAQIDVIETITPLEFNAFRGHLESASGFQSAQFRAIEFVFGRKRETALNQFATASPWLAMLEHYYARPTLWDAFLHFLVRTGFEVPKAVLERDVRHTIEPSSEVQAVLSNVYRTHAGVANVCEGLIDMDEGVQEWRYRHMKMVERTIGAKAGTGGSSGAAYLATTITPFFPDLWAIRSTL